MSDHSIQSSKIKAGGERYILEIMLMIVVIGTTYLMFRMGGYKTVALNLFFLPIVISGYYLGRAHAGVLAFFTALVVTIACLLDSSGFAPYMSTFTMTLALIIWAGVLGLTALLVGTLCDERAAKADELHEAYIGVIEVLSKYLQNGNPRVKARSIRTAETAQLVAGELGLSRQQIDDIRVGALLWDLEDVEVTTRLLSRAVDALEGQPSTHEKHTFLGTDLVHSLAEVLRGAVPLLLIQGYEFKGGGQIDGETEFGSDAKLGANIIRMVRLFDLRCSPFSSRSDRSEGSGRGALQAVTELRKTAVEPRDREIVDALERVVARWERIPATEFVFA